jgi:hypothetical protein
MLQFYSPVFADMLSLPAGNNGIEGTSDEHPFVLVVSPPISTTELDYLFDFIFHR